MSEALPVVFDEEDLNSITNEFFEIEEVNLEFFGISDVDDPERFPAIAVPYEADTLLLFPAKTVLQMTAWLDETIFARTLDRK